MIKAETARRKSQEYNRNFWIKHTLRRLSEHIDRVAAQGNDFYVLSFEEITPGAENLAEVGEMCILIEKELLANGYKSECNPNGMLKITW